MGIEYHVAVHEAHWLSTEKLNTCLADLKYPVQIIPASPADMSKPLQDNPGSSGLTVALNGQQIELEASIKQLRPGEPFAYGFKIEKSKIAEGAILRPTGIDDFVPLDLNDELKKIGMNAPDFGYGDYVVSITFRSSVDEYRAGFLLMAGLIRCANGLGFEFDSASYGGSSFAETLVQQAREME